MPPRNFMQDVRTGIQLMQALGSLAPPALPPSAPKATPIDPMAGMASGDELDRYALQHGGFFMGRIHPDHGENFLSSVCDDRHLFVMAGNRSGKGLTFGIPNALTWEGPLFVIDPKGEVASITALRRASFEMAQGTGTSVRSFVGQKVAILDPHGVVKGPARAFRLFYNPLRDIDMQRGGGVADIQAISEALITQEEGNGAHFAETAERIVAGLIEAIMLNEPIERQNLMQFRSLLLSGFEPLKTYMAKVDTRGGLATEAVTTMDETGPEEWGGHRNTLSRNLSWLSDHEMQDHLSSGEFSLRTAIVEGWSVFVCLPPDEIRRFKSWLRVIVQTVLRAKLKLGFDQTGQQTLCILDEFPTLGRFKIIEESAGYMASMGLKLVPIIQNIGQIKTLYAKNWETFLGNAGAIIAFGLNDLESEKYVADRLGRLFVTETTRSTTTGTSSQFLGSAGSSTSDAYNTGRHERPVRFPNEIHHQGARENMRAFILPASGRGFTVQRMAYTDFPAGFYDSPAFITEWENRNWRVSK